VNLRALPKETTLRFALVVFVVFASALALEESLWYTLYLDHANEVLQRCRSSRPGLAGNRETMACVRSSEHARVIWTVAWAVVVLALGIVGAAVGSAARRRRLRRLPVDRLARTIDLSADVAATNRMDSLPLLWRPGRPIATARADGIRQQYVEVGLTWLGVVYSDETSARAILEHEYAHHRLRDVLPSRITLWTGYALLAAAVPFVAAVWTVGAGTATTALARLAAAGVVVAVARAATLRAREFDADREAARDAPDGMVRALNGAVRAGGPAPTWRRRLTRLVAHHPSAETRLAAVARPATRFGLRASDGALVGLATAITGPVLARLWRGWFQIGDPNLYGELIGWATVGVFMGGWMAIVMVRAVAAEADGEQLRIAPFSLAMALSALVGRLVFSMPLYQPMESLPRTFTDVGATVLFVLALAAAVVWLRGFVEAWLATRVADSGRTAALVPVVAGGALVGGLLVGVLANVLQTSRPYALNRRLTGLDPNEPFTLLSILRAQADTPWVLTMLVVAAATPILLLLLPTNGRRRLPSWLQEDPSPAAEPTASSGADDENPAPAKPALQIALAMAGLGALCAVAGLAAAMGEGDGLERSWYVAANTATMRLTLVGGIVGTAGATVALMVDRVRAPLAALAAAAGSVPAGAGLWLMLRDEPGRGVAAPRLFETVAEVLTVAVVVALLGATLVILAVRRPVAGRAQRTATGLAVPVLATFVLLVPVQWTREARPSAADDRAHYQFVFTTQADMPAVEEGCSNGTLSPEMLERVEHARGRLGEILNTPSTAEVHEVHELLLGTFDACTMALRDALENAGRRDETLFATFENRYAAFRGAYLSAGLTVPGTLSVEL
jgi:hypothetical protein